MRGLSPSLVAAAVGLLALSATPAAAVDEPPTVDTVLVPATPPPTSVDLAPGESPGAIDLESGPVLEYPLVGPAPVVEGTDTTVAQSTTEPPPAGPTLLDDSLLDNGSPSTRTALYLVMLTAVPSLTVGLALWIQRGDALAQRRLMKAKRRTDR